MLGRVRSLLVIALAAAAFGYSLWSTEAQAQRMRANEAVALAAMYRLGPAGPAPERIDQGYRFAWTTEGPGLPLLVGSPVLRGRDGLRWFATCDGHLVLDFDTAEVPIPAGGLELRRLRAYLSAPPERRRPRDFPPGWRFLQ